MLAKDYFEHDGFFYDDDSVDAEIARHTVAVISMPLNGGRVLDIGCGTGSMFKHLLENGAFEITGIDFSEPMIQEASNRINDARITLTNSDFYDFSEDGFDVAIAFNSYNYFLDPELFVKKAYSILQKHGRLTVAFSFGRDRTNVLCSMLPEGISRQILRPWEELKHWDKYFIVDCMCDTEQTYILSGTKK